MKGIAAIHERVTRNGLQTGVGSLANRVSGVENCLANIENRESGLETRFAGIENRMTDIENSITELQNNITIQFSPVSQSYIYSHIRNLVLMNSGLAK